MFNLNGCIVILMVFFSFAFVYLVIYKFPQMKKLLRREHYNGLYPIYSELQETMVFNNYFLKIFQILLGFVKYDKISQ